MSEEQNDTAAPGIKRSNKELWQEWAIDVHQDPNAMPLDKLNPAHPSLFEADTIFPYFKRLRAEDPVHY